MAPSAVTSDKFLISMLVHLDTKTVRSPLPLSLLDTHSPPDQVDWNKIAETNGLRDGTAAYKRFWAMKKKFETEAGGAPAAAKKGRVVKSQSPVKSPVKRAGKKGAATKKKVKEEEETEEDEEEPVYADEDDDEDHVNDGDDSQDDDDA
ncbi:hypothetical protein KEM56_004211 [Ascosphaera pollenicola]|nr:hypothetical protein KEM56_004211 [Ascosphaera pollenicola]